MSIARDDAGNIRELHTKASGVSPNFRDASGGTGGTRQCVNFIEFTTLSVRTTGCLPTDGRKTPRQSFPQEKYVYPEPPLTWSRFEPSDRSWSMQGHGSSSNPFSGRLTSGDARQVEGRDGKAGSSSRSRLAPSRQTTKRRKLGHQADVSKYFVGDVPERRGSLAIPSTSTSSRPSSATANAIIIDEEDDAPATIDDPDSHAAIVLRTSSPDPMDVIGPNHCYVFDQSKPSPIHTFSSTLEEKRKSPQDGESTFRLRNTMKKIEPRTIESVSRPDSDDDGLRRISKTLPGMLARNEVTAQAEASSGRGYVKEQVALLEGNNKPGGPPHLNLKTLQQTKKDGMKPKQVGLPSVMCTTVPATE